MTNTTRRMTALLCAFIGLLAGVAAALGVFARGDGTFTAVTSALGERYEIAESGVYAGSARQLVAEGIGWDVFTLFVAVPILLVASVFVARGSFRGTLVAAGMLGYFFYMHLEYAVTWSFGPLFGLFIATYGLSLVGLVGVAALVARDGVAGRFDDRFPRRAWAGLSIGMGLLLAVMWIGRIVDALQAEIPALHGETTMTVQALDLGLVVPVAILVAVLALRGNAAGLAASAAFAVTFVTMCAAIGAMMISASIVNGVAQVPPIVIFGAASVAGLFVGRRMYASAGARGGHRFDSSSRDARPVELPAAG